MNHGIKTKYKRYDEAFKRSAVEHWLVSGKSARQIAAELGVNQQSLQQWKTKFKMLPAGQVAPTLDALQAENRRLQRELPRAQQQRDILKKTLGIISAPRESDFVRIEARQEEYSIAQLCAALNVARSGYHAWAQARAPRPTPRSGRGSSGPMKKVTRPAGARRICQQLKQQGHGCSRQRVARPSDEEPEQTAFSCRPHGQQP